MWDAIAPEVTERLAPPNLGYPPLEPVPRGRRVTVADDVAHLLTQLPEAGSFHVVAHSYGGLVALLAAQRMPQRVQSLFLLEPVMFGALAADEGASPEAKAHLAQFLETPAFLDDEAQGGTEPWLTQFIDYWNRPGSWERLPDFMRAHSLAMGWKMFNEVRSVFRDSGTYQSLTPPRVPLTLVIGERSTVGAKEMVRAFAARNSHARVVELPGTGHMAPLTHPAKVNEALAAHLQGVAAPGLQSADGDATAFATR